MFKAAHEGFAPDNQYFAVGFYQNAGQRGGAAMIGADAIISSFDVDTDTPSAVDYQMTGPSACRNGAGVCPDTMLASPGVNDVFNVSGYYQDGIHVVSYVRPISTMDVTDEDVQTGALFFLFAQGQMDRNGLPMNHGPDNRGIVELNLGRGSSVCNALEPNTGVGGGNPPARGSAATLKSGLALALMLFGSALL